MYYTFIREQARSDELLELLRRLVNNEALYVFCNCRFEDWVENKSTLKKGGFMRIVTEQAQMRTRSLQL